MPTRETRVRADTLAPYTLHQRSTKNSLLNDFCFECHILLASVTQFVFDSVGMTLLLLMRPGEFHTVYPLFLRWAKIVS